MTTLKLAALLALVATGLSLEARAETSAPQPAAAQPTLPGSDGDAPAKSGSPVVDQIVRRDQPQLIVRKQAAHRSLNSTRHRWARAQVPRDLRRPALAGVELLAPLPPPGELPHIAVPLPAYPLETIASVLTTPLPPIVCRQVRRDPDAPDPRLYREVPVVCEADNP